MSLQLARDTLTKMMYEKERIDLACAFRWTARMGMYEACLLYTSPSPRDRTRSRMPSSA